MHLGSETALDLIEERAESAETEFWMGHLNDCADCLESFRALAILRGRLLKKGRLEDAPQSAIGRAEGIFRSSTAADRPKVREVASLLFDSFNHTAFAGARGSAADTRQMVLRTEGFDVHVKIWANAPKRKLAGQVLARMESTFADGYRLNLYRDGEHVETTLADQFGEFEFLEVPDGSLSLEIELPHMTLVGALNSQIDR